MTKINLISVVVTCYNRENTIRECLESIKNQTFKRFECLIVDDGSTDKSKDIIKECIKDDSRFTLIESEHVGFPLAKNIGLDNVKGDYVIFLDSDDIAYTYWLELLYIIAIQTSAPIVTCTYEKFEETPDKETPFMEVIKKGLVLNEYSDLKMLLLFHGSCLSYMWNKLIRRDLYDGIRHEDQMALSDVSVMYKIFEKAEKIIRLWVPLVHYRIHKESMTITSRLKGSEYNVFRLNLFKKVLREIFDKYPLSGYVVQIVLHKEIDQAKEALGKDFESLITLDDIQYILDARTAHITLA